MDMIFETESYSVITGWAKIVSELYFKQGDIIKLRMDNMYRTLSIEKQSRTQTCLLKNIIEKVSAHWRIGILLRKRDDSVTLIDFKKF